MADYRLLPHSEEDESAREMEDSDENDNDRKKKNKIKSKGGKRESDPVLDVIGEFGPYQAWICFVGFLMNMVHAWLSLSLKFVGMKTKFVCLDSSDSEQDNSSEDADQCFVKSKGSTKPCTAWTYDETDFKGSIVERWNLVCDKGGEENIAQSVFFAGCLVGVFLAGQASDRFGRKPITIALLVIFIATACAGGIVTSWTIWLSLRFVVGAASIGMVTVRYTIQVSFNLHLEVVPDCQNLSGGDDRKLLAILRQHRHLLWLGCGIHHPPSSGLHHARHASARNRHRPLNVSNPSSDRLLSSGVAKVAANRGKVEEGCCCLEPCSCLESTSCSTSSLFLSLHHRVFILLVFSPLSSVLSTPVALPSPDVLLLALLWHGLLRNCFAHP